MTNLRRLSLPLLLSAFQFFSISAFSQDAPITSAEAKDSIGQSKTVSGTVMKVTTLAKTVVLEFDGVYPNAPFTGVIFNEKLPSFDKAVLESYQGKVVSITGKIAEYKGKPQIVLNEPSQIVASGAAPAVFPANTGQPSAAQSAPAPPAASEQPTTAPAAGDKKNLLTNGNWNKGKKGWELPPDADVVADGDSQVLKVQLKPGERVYVKQVLDAKIPKTAGQFQVSFDAKLADGTNIERVTARLGPSFKDSVYNAFKLKAAPGSWEEMKWPKTGAPKSMDNLIFSLEFDPGEGSVFIDNIQLLPAP